MDRQEQRTYLIANGITGEAATLMDEMETRINGKPVYMQKESDTEYPIEVLHHMVMRGEIHDAKTIIAILMVRELMTEGKLQVKKK